MSDWEYTSPDDGGTIIRTNKNTGKREYLIRYYGGSIAKMVEWCEWDVFYEKNYEPFTPEPGINYSWEGGEPGRLVPASVEESIKVQKIRKKRGKKT